MYSSCSLVKGVNFPFGIALEFYPSSPSFIFADEVRIVIQ